MGYTLKLNHMADVTDKEFQKNKGLLKEEEKTGNGGLKFALSDRDTNKKLPSTVDWNKAGE